jgi:hypothetical protein
MQKVAQRPGPEKCAAAAPPCMDAAPIPPSARNSLYRRVPDPSGHFALRLIPIWLLLHPGLYAYSHSSPQSRRDMDDFNSETDSDYTSYWRDWVGTLLSQLHVNPRPRSSSPWLSLRIRGMASSCLRGTSIRPWTQSRPDCGLARRVHTKDSLLVSCVVNTYTLGLSSPTSPSSGLQL